MSYEVDKYITAKAEDYDEPRIVFNNWEDLDAFRQSRINADCGLVMEIMQEHFNKSYKPTNQQIW